MAIIKNIQLLTMHDVQKNYISKQQIWKVKVKTKGSTQFVVCLQMYMQKHVLSWSVSLFFYFYNLDNRTSLKNTGLLETDHSTNFKVIIIKSKCSLFSPFQILEEKAFSNQNKNKKKAKTQQQNFFQDFQPKKLGYLVNSESVM